MDEAANFHYWPTHDRTTTQQSALGFPCRSTRARNSHSTLTAHEKNMTSLIQIVGSFVDEEDGTTAVEYAVMLALILAVCIGSVTVLASRVADSFDTSSNAIAGAFAN